jgi:hypothetical protein
MTHLLNWLHHFFVPHQGNNYKAKILHPASLSVLVTLFLVAQFGLNFFILISPHVLGFASNITPEQVIELTNQKRLENGLPPLRLNQTLTQAALAKAGDMFAFNYWAHVSPSGRDPWAFFREAGYNYLYAGENLARDFNTSEAVVEAWMNSPSHRDNLLNGRYQEIGLAVVDGTLEGVETTLVVQLFGTPTPAPAAQETRKTSVPELGEATAMETTVEEEVKEEVVEPLPMAITTTNLNQATGKERSTLPFLSPFFLTKTLVILVMSLLFGALVFDWLLVYRQKVVRLSGRNLAHLALIGTLLLAALLTQQGAIL